MLPCFLAERLPMHARDTASTSGKDVGRTPAAPSSARPPAFSGGDRSPQAILALQRTAGNAAVSALLQRAGGSFEQHQHGAGCGHHQAEQPAVQRSAVHDVLKASGQPMAAPLRTEMEGRLGSDFSDVRLHTDSAARDSAAEVGARAYTSGNHVVIGDGGGDKHTLAHELTHVVQQRQGPVAGTDSGGGLKISDPSDAFERAAEANATRVMRATGPQVEAAHADLGGHEQSSVQRSTVPGKAQASLGTQVVQRVDDGPEVGGSLRQGMVQKKLRYACLLYAVLDSSARDEGVDEDYRKPPESSEHGEDDQESIASSESEEEGPLRSKRFHAELAGNGLCGGWVELHKRDPEWLQGLWECFSQWNVGDPSDPYFALEKAVEVAVAAGRGLDGAKGEVNKSHLTGLKEIFAEKGGAYHDFGIRELAATATSAWEFQRKAEEDAGYAEAPTKLVEAAKNAGTAAATGKSAPGKIGSETEWDLEEYEGRNEEEAASKILAFAQKNQGVSFTAHFQTPVHHMSVMVKWNGGTRHMAVCETEVAGIMPCASEAEMVEIFKKSKTFYRPDWAEAGDRDCSIDYFAL